jgi:hypothetical protein
MEDIKKAIDLVEGDEVAPRDGNLPVGGIVKNTVVIDQGVQVTFENGQTIHVAEDYDFIIEVDDPKPPTPEDQV